MARLWLIVPAAGIGSRMQADRPKQYLTIGGRLLLDITLQRLLGFQAFESLWLALHPEDEWWHGAESASRAEINVYTGGVERVDSVCRGLDAIRETAAPDDWVFVHDVARPCVRYDDLARLLSALEDEPVGALLGAPVSDTVKRVGDSERVMETVPRSGLWRAFTPQVFRFALLDEALREASRKGVLVTDEASAVEALGHRPRMVEGHTDNIKVTVPADLAMAAWTLERITKGE